ncbi:cofilin [Entomortierella parvispora]|uniref:Cofilin n=1 Tax=Entomortierella parvispora TaxID=205924 RepID=A0A9P3H4Z9_9FUNG|nr:cofilin [Entomortierella parvispora]
MSLSGVSLQKGCVESFTELKLKKAHKFIIYKLSDDLKEIVVDKAVSAGTYDEFLAELPVDQCRYAVYDFDYTLPDGERNKIVFYTWSPDDAKTRTKMVYSSSKDALRKALQGVAIEIQGTDLDEVAHDTVLERIRR